MQETETTPVTPSDTPSAKKSGGFPFWLWLVPVVGICAFLICLAGSGGLVFWRLGSNQPESGEPVVGETLPVQTAEVATLFTATPISTPDSSAPTATPLLLPTSTPPATSSPTPLPEFCGSPEPAAQPTMAAPIFSSISFATAQDET